MQMFSMRRSFVAGRCCRLLCLLASFGAIADSNLQKPSEVDIQVVTTVKAEELRYLYAQPKSQWPAPNISESVNFSEIAPPPVSKVTSVELAALGKQLFHDPVLSADKQVSCASCHEPRLAFQDNREKAVGIQSQLGTRNTPPIFGIDAWQSFFWDGRAASAEQQALQPIANPIEMNLPIEQALQRLNANDDYRRAFKSIFAEASTPEFQISAEHLGKAIAEFERSIQVPNSRFIRFLQLAESPIPEKRAQGVALLTDQELQGLHLFRTKARCMNCHQGSLLSDNQFHVTGLVYFGREQQDLGLYEVTKNPQDSGKFRTPSLWLLSKTFPWMHNGFTDSLNVVVQFYNNGGIPLRSKKHGEHPLFPVRSALLQNLALTNEEKQALIKFLQQL